MTMSERQMRIVRNRQELCSDPNRTLVPGQVPTRNAVFRVKHGRKIETFGVLGRHDVPYSAIHRAHEISSTVHAVWDEK